MLNIFNLIKLFNLFKNLYYRYFINFCFAMYHQTYINLIRKTQKYLVIQKGSLILNNFFIHCLFIFHFHPLIINICIFAITKSFEIYFHRILTFLDKNL